MNDLIFLDTETTGLEPEKHEVWEIAWTVNDELMVHERIMNHSLKTADLGALGMNGYWDRASQGLYPKWGEDWDLEIRKVVEGNTLVCANPTFDRMMLRARWGLEPYHYRSIDVESMALAVLQYDRPKGLKGIADDLREIGYTIERPDHSARGDVIVLRQCYKALRSEMSAYPRKTDLAEIHNKMVEKGIITPNEVRRRVEEGL